MHIHTKQKVTGPCSQMPNSSNHQHKIPVFKGKAASQNTVQASVLVAPVASMAAVQGRAALFVLPAFLGPECWVQPTAFKSGYMKSPAQLCKNIMDLYSEVLEKWHEKIKKSDTATKSIPQP